MTVNTITYENYGMGRPGYCVTLVLDGQQIAFGPGTNIPGAPVPTRPRRPADQESWNRCGDQLISRVWDLTDDEIQSARDWAAHS